MKIRLIRFFAGILVFCVSGLFAQEGNIDFNSLYRYNFSVGVEIQNLSPIPLTIGDLNLSPVSQYQNFATMTDYSIAGRIPLPFFPQIQPLIQVGAIIFTSTERGDPEKWNHTNWYAALGGGYYHRLNKSFEFGGDLTAGLTSAIWQDIDNDPATEEIFGSYNFLATLGLRVAFDPFYSLSLDFHPSLKYFKYLGDATQFGDFDGFIFGLSVSLHYRAGEDPDAPRAVIRSLKFGDKPLEPLFAAMQSYYVKNPIGTVTIENIETFPIYDIELSFFQAGFMDNPAKSALISQLDPGETRDVELFASFNSNVFSTEGITPLIGEVSAQYMSRNKAAAQTSSISYDLHDKTALTWDDEAKVGAFITSSDSALRNYASMIRQYCKDDIVPVFSPALQTGMQIYYALKELGILYQRDPTSPFDAAQENPVIVDSISIPRDTLQRLTGDCDDLTVTFCSLMETTGIETAYITIPGHIFPAFNTKVPSSDYAMVHNEKEMTISIGGELWIPVEITMVADEDFLDAWRTAVDEYNSFEGDDVGINFTRKAQEIFRPVGLVEADLGLQYGRKNEIVDNFSTDMAKLVDTVLESFNKRAEETGKKKAYNDLGIACAQYGRFIQAEDAFNIALSLDRNYLNPKINLGNLFFMQDEFQRALLNYHNAERNLVEKGRETSNTFSIVLLNLSKTYYELENFDKATEYFDKCVVINPSIEEKYKYLKAGDEDTKASDAGGKNTVLFADEEE